MKGHKHSPTPRRMKEGDIVRVCSACHKVLEPDLQGDRHWPKVARSRARREAQRHRARTA